MAECVSVFNNILFASSSSSERVKGRDASFVINNMYKKLYAGFFKLYLLLFNGQLSTYLKTIL